MYNVSREKKRRLTSYLLQPHTSSLLEFPMGVLIGSFDRVYIRFFFRLTFSPHFLGRLLEWRSFSSRTSTCRQSITCTTSSVGSVRLLPSKAWSCTTLHSTKPNIYHAPLKLAAWFKIMPKGNFSKIKLMSLFSICKINSQPSISCRSHVLHILQRISRLMTWQLRLEREEHVASVTGALLEMCLPHFVNTIYIQSCRFHTLSMDARKL